MTEERRIIKAKSDKFRQINRFLEYIEDVLSFLNKEKHGIIKERMSDLLTDAFQA